MLCRKEMGKNIILGEVILKIQSKHSRIITAKICLFVQEIFPFAYLGFMLHCVFIWCGGEIKLQEELRIA